MDPVQLIERTKKKRDKMHDTKEEAHKILAD